MRFLGQLALAFALLVAFAAPAAADQMSGTYAGTGISQGTTLNLTHEGFNISGDFSGLLNGTFYGQTDGGDYAEGFLTESGTTYTYYLDWTPTQLTITIYDTEGNQLAYAFAPQGTTTEPPGQQTTITTTRPGDPQPDLQFSELNFHVYAGGVQSGPFTIDEMIGKIQSGEIARDTLVWLRGTPEWVPAENVNLLAEAFPPPPPTVATYYALIDGQQTGPLPPEAILTSISAGTIAPDTLMWTAGMAEWAPAATFEEFAEALVPPMPPPPPVPPTPPTPPPVTPPAPPVTPPSPPSTNTSGLDPGAIEQIIRRNSGQIGTDDRVRESVQCFMRELDALSVEQQSAMIETDFEVSTAMRDAIEAEHPGFNDRARGCAVLAAALPPPDLGLDIDTEAQKAMIVRRLDAQVDRVPQAAVDATVACFMDLITSFTPVEQAEMLAVDGIMPEEMTARFEAAHPEMNDRSETCVAMLQADAATVPPTLPLTPPSVEPSALEAMIRQNMGVRISGYTPDEMTTLVDCLMGVFVAFTPDEQTIMLDTAGRPSPEQEDALEAAHPGYKQQKQDCVFPTPKADPAVAGGEPNVPPRADGGDPLTVAVREYFSRMGLGGAALDGAIECTMAGYSVLTAEERQILADHSLMPSPSQMLAIQKAHPDMDKGVQACFDEKVN